MYAAMGRPAAPAPACDGGCGLYYARVEAVEEEPLVPALEHGVRVRMGREDRLAVGVVGPLAHDAPRTAQRGEDDQQRGEESREHGSGSGGRRAEVDGTTPDTTRWRGLTGYLFNPHRVVLTR